MRQPDSPITAELLAEGNITISQVVVDKSTTKDNVKSSLGDELGGEELLYWLESRPNENGRSVICRRLPDGQIEELSSPAANISTGVHTYGGAAWWVESDTLYFQDANYSRSHSSGEISGALYVQSIGDELKEEKLRGGKSKTGKSKEGAKLIAECDGVQFADGRPAGKYFICVTEREQREPKRNISENMSEKTNKKTSKKTGDKEPIAQIEAVPLDGSKNLTVLVSGADFYSSPRLSKSLNKTSRSSDSKPENIFADQKLAWLQWNHPNMSWDKTELWVGDFSADLLNTAKPELSNMRKVAEGSWISQPEWLDENRLTFISEEDNWSKFFICDTSKGEAIEHDKTEHDEIEYNETAISLLKSFNAEVALPEWSFGESRYCFGDLSNDNHLDGNPFDPLDNSLDTNPDHLASLAYATSSGGSEQLNVFGVAVEGYSSFSQIRKYKDGVIALAGSPERLQEIVYFAGDGSHEILYAPNQLEELTALIESIESTALTQSTQAKKLDSFSFSVSEAVEFPSGEDGVRKTAYGLFYPAIYSLGTKSKDSGLKNKAQKNEADSENKASDELPPLIVMAHGGPTGAARTSLYLPQQFWTSRGFNVLDVNYRGSTGFGKKYRQALNGKWGVADVNDCIAGAKYLIDAGLVNENQIAIRGSSAGGMTVLLALAESDVFSCGAIKYGVVDLVALEKITHKFESHYIKQLVGSEVALKQRSPINHLDKINTPLLIMSGTNDPVVPLEQSQQLAKALKERKVKHELLLFEGEGHGFHRADSLIKAQTAELEFFLSCF